MGLALLHSCCCSIQKTYCDVHVGDWKGERDCSVKHDFPPTKMTWLKLRLTIIEGTLRKYPIFLKIQGDSLSKTPPFCWNPRTMPQTKKLPLFPCKCGLAYAPPLDWTAVAGHHRMTISMGIHHLNDANGMKSFQAVRTLAHCSNLGASAAKCI